MRTSLRVGGALVLGALAAPAMAQDAAAGRKIASGACQSCHGLDGLAKMPEMPNIAGDDAAYITRQLEAYKSGERKNELMSAVAPMLDAKKMADVAAYYSGIQVEIVQLPGQASPRGPAGDPAMAAPAAPSR